MRVMIHIGLILGATAFAADLESGKRLVQEKNYPEAERVLRDVVTAEPDSVEANYYLGLALLGSDKYKESEPFLQRAAPKMPAAKVGLARAYMMQDRLPDAQRLLDEAAKTQPDNAENYRVRGMILLKQNKIKDAIQQLTRATELDPKDAYAHYYLGMASSRDKRPDQMVKHFELFLALAPNAPEAARVRSLLRVR